MQFKLGSSSFGWTSLAAGGILLGAAACSSGGLVTTDSGPPKASGGAPGTGGTSSGGAVSTGGTGSGGDPATGGAASGGSGGSATGGGGGNDGVGGGADFFGESRCEGQGFLLCDGFEGDSIDSALWTVEKSAQNTVELVSDRAARGSKSVHIVAQNGYGYLKNTSIFPVTNNDYFGRMFLRVARFSTVDWAHWTVGEGAGTGDGSLIRVGGQYRTDISANRWGVGSDGGPTGDWTIHDNDPNGAPTEPPIDTWVCLEWEHKGSTNETHFFVDNAPHPSLSTTATDHGGTNVDYVLPQMTSFWFGWYQYQQDPEQFDVWIDEVVLDDQRIGCTK